MLNTRFRRCAQLMYGGGVLVFFFTLWMGATLATFGGRHFNTVLAVGCKHPVEPSQVYSWFGHQHSQRGSPEGRRWRQINLSRCLASAETACDSGLK